MSGVINNPTTNTEFLAGLPIPWLNSNPIGQGNANVLGYMFDFYYNMALQAVQVRFPTYAPKDALRYIGDERGLLQGVSESDADFAIRLKLAWIYWALAGTPIGVLFELYNQGYADGYLVQVNGPIYSISGTPDVNDPISALVKELAGINPNIDGDPEWWTFDYNTEFTSRFALLFPSVPAQWTDVQSTAPPLGIGPRIGTTSDTSSPSTSDINTIYNIVNKWKPAKATFMGIFLTTAGETIGFPVDTIAERNTRNGGIIGSPAIVVQY